jgi:DNA-binding transcriptional ArsR family regulator
MSNFCLNNLDDMDFLKEAFNILSEPNRIKIFCLLAKNDRLCVCEIIEKL